MSKLPASPGIETAYLKALGVEKYAQTWSPEWSYGTPKAVVVASLTESLQTLQVASAQDRTNHELQLLTGLVAHLAYNVDVESAYDPAVAQLTAAMHGNPGDVRGQWFLGIHQCQSLHVAEGMNDLLALESSGKKLPPAFWDDYVSCASTAIMPAHTLRAIDHELEAGQNSDRFRTLRSIAESRYKTADLAHVIETRDAWVGSKTADGNVVFESRLCGLQFTVKENWPMRIGAVTEKGCVVVLKAPPQGGEAANGSIFVMVHPAKPDEKLEDFLRTTATQSGDQVISTSCALEKCVALEAVNKNMYVKEGGAHTSVVGFERDVPQYDGLIFETPQQPPQSGAPSGLTAYKPVANFKRIPGRVFYAVMLDATEKVYAASKSDFDFVMGSMHVE
ncbi:MAG TPA: hypothetical protein VGN16_11030 [Acidobacteriaceae bacterium]